jgi:small ligand-binding sensory domain FIST
VKWASTVAEDTKAADAVARAADAVTVQLDGRPPDLVVIFVSYHHWAEYERIPELIAARLSAGLLIGCSAGGVIGGGREVEERPGLALNAARLPGVAITPFHLQDNELPAAAAATGDWEHLLRVPATPEPHFLLLPDPFSFDAESFVRGLDTAYPRSRKIGGLASGGRQPGSNALFLGTGVQRSGLVGVALSGNVDVDTIVAQGCRPVGDPMFVTRCQQHILWELDGRRPLEVLQELYERLDQRDQELARHSLFLGIVMREDRVEYGQGDFLIRNIIGSDATSGALAVGATLHESSVVQFHLRDAETSTADLDALLARYAARHHTPPEGSLLFSCLGRGKHLYGRPDQDTDTFRRHLGDVPLGGFFCNGEIGPVHGSTFLHGYTSSFGLFRSR